MYGKAPGPLNPELVKMALGEEQPITCRPADLIPSGWEQAEREAGENALCEEDVLTYALFPTVAPKFLEAKRQRIENTQKYKIEAIGRK